METIGKVSSKNQITLPVALMRLARVQAGDRVRFTVDGQGRITLAAIRPVPDVRKFIGVWRNKTPYASGEDLVADLRGPIEE